MRLPRSAGRFYPSDPTSLTACIESCFESPIGPGIPGEEGSARRILGIMAPHAGYMASGMNAAHAYRALKEDGLPDVYVIIGPDHYGTAHGTVICSEPFLTPFGPCRTDERICGALAETYEDSLSAHLYEHSVEVHVPFIQYIDPDPRIVPIMMGRQTPSEARRLADALASACEGRDVVVVASTDLSHYIPSSEASRLDGMALDRVAAMDPEGLYDTVRANRISMCGYGPTMAAMMFCEGCSARVLKHSDSYDSLGMDPEAVVGYGSAVFEKKAV
ncbi:MAG: AmmeMemoRadiSam system protein B [Candidatus Methanomethylophilaceae archaeon]|nr:AmmeMemoRadiSam system protein B [Candidatus Methanomethylophilaceae archaeon]